MALGFQPALLSHCPRGEEIRVILRSHFCSVNLLSSVCGRNEVLLKLTSWGQRAGVVESRRHPKVSVAQTFISSMNTVDFHYHVWGRRQHRWAAGRYQVAESTSNPEPFSDAHFCLVFPLSMPASSCLSMAQGPFPWPSLPAPRLEFSVSLTHTQWSAC